jgi:hypothetical protein
MRYTKFYANISRHLYFEALTWTGEGDAEPNGNHLDVGEMELWSKAEHHMLSGPTVCTNVAGVCLHVRFRY